MSNVSSERLFEFKKTVNMLKRFRGTGTQLVSLYIPAGYPIHEAANKIREEISQAQNIKSKQTRNNVIAALERILNVLKGVRKTPENGLVIFAGNVGAAEGKDDIRTFVVEPLYKLNQSIYRCDSTFFTEPLENMLSHTDAYGLVVMDGREATIGLLKGTEIIPIKTIHSTAHAKVRKGGQSARRYERLIEEATERYYQRVGEAMDKAFLGKVKGVIVGGPGPSKEYFLEAKPFNYQLKVLGVVDTGYTGEYGLHELVSKAGEILKEQEAVKEKKLVEKFMKQAIKGKLATYGLREVMEAIESNRAGLVLVSEELKDPVRKWKCPKCGHEEVEIGEVSSAKECPKCGSAMMVEEDVSLAEYIIEKAHQHGIKVEVISTNTSEGAQFFYGFGGVGALLRY